MMSTPSGFRPFQAIHRRPKPQATHRNISQNMGGRRLRASLKTKQLCALPPKTALGRVGPFYFDKEQQTIQQQACLRRLVKFYNTAELKKLWQLNTSRDSSWRMIMYFVTTFTNQRVGDCLHTEELFGPVHQSYKQALKRHPKRLCAFRRGPRVYFRLPAITGAEVVHVTTVAQLNFFHWMHTTNVWDLFLKHKPNVELAMHTTAQVKRKKQKRLELHPKKQSLMGGRQVNTTPRQLSACTHAQPSPQLQQGRHCVRIH